MNTTRQLLLTALVLAVFRIANSAGVVPAWVEGGPGTFPPNFYIRHSVTEDSKGNIWLFGGNTFNCAFTIGELWKLNVKDNFTWSQIVSQGNTPAVRSDFYIWSDKNDNLYVFGGRSSCNDSLSDLWTFNTTSLTWSIVRASGTLDRGTIGAATSTTHPGPRVGNAAWLANDNELWLYGGGVAGVDTLYQDVWKFSLQTQLWTCMIDRGTTQTSDALIEYPAQRSFRSIATIDTSGNAWIFDMTSPTYSVFSRIKLSSLEWTVIGTYSSPVYGTLGTYSSTTQPASYHVGSIVYIGNDILALTTTNINHVLNQWYYNIGTGQWALMFGPTDSTTVPTLTYGQFQQIDPAGTPAIRSYYGTSVTQGNTWIVRGYTNGNRVNDTWVFPVNRCNTDISPCDTNAACTDHLGWTECVCNSGYEGNGHACSVIVPPVSEPVSSPVSVPAAQPLAAVPAFNYSPDTPIDLTTPYDGTIVASGANAMYQASFMVVVAFVLL